MKAENEAKANENTNSKNISKNLRKKFVSREAHVACSPINIRNQLEIIN